MIDTYQRTPFGVWENVWDPVAETAENKAIERHRLPDQSMP
jgi:hypothetical protein